MGSYYDVDAILTDAEKVPCTFNLDLPGLGFLDESPNEDIRANTTHPLPLWLATLLCVQRLGQSGNAIVTLSPPPAIAGDRQLNALKADSRVVDLRSWCRFYWGFGGRWVELWDDDEVVEVLNESFKIRAAEIADFAHNPRGAPGEFAQRMDETEWRLFRAARDSSRAAREWLGESRKKG